MIAGEIIVIGSELLFGGRTDTNSVFLSEMLASVGIQVRFKTVVGDEVMDISQALGMASRRAQIVLVTGGLGPTADDLTREAVSRATGRKLRRRDTILRALKERFAREGRAITPNQYRQAELPVGASCLPNRVGTAPGFSMKWKKCRLFCLPGVSREARQMFTHGVYPILVKEGYVRAPFKSRTIHTFGIIEGVVDEAITGLVPVSGKFHLGILASPLGVSISLTEIPNKQNDFSKSNNGKMEENKATLEVLVGEVSSRLGPNVYGYDHERMEEIVGKKLLNSGYSIGLAESCTGGLIGHRLTQVSGSSAYFERGIISYSNQAKIDVLGVPPIMFHRYGAVSAKVAERMAEGIRVRSQADIGLSVTGIAGPSGGTKGKPVGLVYVGLSTPTGLFSKEFRFHGDREMVKLRSSQGALDVVRRYLSGFPIVDK